MSTALQTITNSTTSHVANPDSPWLSLIVQPLDIPTTYRYPAIVRLAHQDHIRLLRRKILEFPDMAECVNWIRPLNLSTSPPPMVAKAMQNYSDALSYRMMDLFERIITREEGMVNGPSPTSSIVGIYYQVKDSEKEHGQGSKELDMVMRKLWIDEQRLRRYQWLLKDEDAVLNKWWEEIEEIRSVAIWDCANAQNFFNETPDADWNVLWPWIARQELRHGNIELKAYTYC